MSNNIQGIETAYAEMPAAAAPSVAAVPSDRRRHGRTRTFLVATVNYGRLLLPCFVLDVSAGGAKIKLLEPSELPEGPAVLECGRFGKLLAQIVWRRGLFAGLKFAEGHTPRNLASLTSAN